MVFMGGDKLYFHVFTFRESLLVKPSPWKCGAGKGVHLADLCQAKGAISCSSFWPPHSLSARTAGTGGKDTGKGGSRARALEVLGIHLPSSHLVAMMPKAKTTVAKTPIMAA